jgi:integrase
MSAAVASSEDLPRGHRWPAESLLSALRTWSMIAAGPQLQLGPVKTDGSARVIPVPAPLPNVLRAHRRAQVEERQTAGQAWQDGGFVFTTGLGTPIEPRNINRHFDKLCASSGVRRIRFHDLRHSCASLLWSQGVPLEQIQDILGHEDPRTTKTIYVDVAEELQRGAVDKLGFLFEETGE